MKKSLLLCASLLLAGCVSPQQAKYQKYASLVHSLPLYEQKAYLQKSYAGGLLTKPQYDQLMAEWEADKNKVEAEADKVAAMTSNDRAAYLYAQHQAQQVAATRQQYASGENEVSVVENKQQQKNAAYAASHPTITPSSQLYTPVPYSTAPPSVVPSGPMVHTGY